MALVCAMTMGLAACGQGDGKAGPNGKTESVRAASGDEATQQKFGLYTEAFNKLIDEHWGVPENFGKYEKLNLPTANPSSSIYFPENITTLEQAIAKLKEGRALSGGGKSQRADTAVDKLIPQLEALLAQWKTLDPYFESRAYRDDGLAKAKAAHPALMAAYQSSVAGIGELDAALSEYQRARNAAQIAALTKSGHTAEASLVDAMQKADHFTTAVLEDKPEEADRLLPGLVEADGQGARSRSEDGGRYGEQVRVQLHRRPAGFDGRLMARLQAEQVRLRAREHRQRLQQRHRPDGRRRTAVLIAMPSPSRRP